MEIRENIKNFLENKEVSVNFLYDKKDYIARKEILTPNLSILFIKENNKNLLKNTEEIYTFAFNDKNEILHINPTNIHNIEPVIDIAKENIYDYNFINDITNIIQSRVESYYKNNKEKIFKNYDFEKNKKNIIKSYFKNESNEIPKINLNLEISRDLLINYFTNKDKFLNALETKCIKDYQKQFESYYIEKEARKLFIEEIEEAGSIIQIQKKITDIYRVDKFKTLTYTFELPNGHDLIEKDIYDDFNNWSDQRSNINKGFVRINSKNFPLSSIKSITWKRKNLYDRDNIKNLNIDNKTILNNFIKVSNYSYLPEEKNKDENFVFNICKKDIKALQFFSNFNTNKNFCYKLLVSLKNSDKYMHLINEMIKNKLFYKDIDYTNKILDFMIENNKKFFGTTFEFLNQIDFQSIDSIDTIKKINDVIPNISKENMINKTLEKLNKNILNSQEFKDNINIFKPNGSPINYISPDEIISKIDNIELLTELFDNDTLLLNINYINTDILYNKEFVLDLCKHHTNNISLRFDIIEPVLNIYKKDLNPLIKNELAKLMPNHYETLKFLNALNIDIPPSDTEEFVNIIYELADVNIIFLNHLDRSPEKQEIFLIGNLLSFDEVEYNENNNSFIITGDFYKAIFQMSEKHALHYYNVNSITYYDNLGHSITITSPNSTKKIAKEIHEEICDRYPALKSIPENDKEIYNFSNFLKKINFHINKDEPEI